MLIHYLNQQLLEREAQGLRRQRRTALSPCSARQSVRTHDGQTQELLTFCSNDYLGLANHPAIAEAMAEGARLYGSGSGASHLISGHGIAHERLEDRLAEWLQPCIPQARAITFCTGFMANLALLTALGDGQATILADKLNHASLIDGALLAKAPMQRYAHNQLAVLEKQLAQCQTPIKLIVTDGVFSMDGDLAHLPDMLALAERYDAWLVVDDAHGFGVLGPHGQGSLAHFGLSSERFIYMGTLGKAAGVSGAFVAAHPTIIDWLVQSARSYIYTTASTPAQAHAVMASLNLIAADEGRSRRTQLQQRITQLREGIANLTERSPQLGWSLMPSITAIQPLVVGDNRTALKLSQQLEALGFWVPAIRPPTVPAGTARLRVTLSAAHTAEDVSQLLHAIGQLATHTS